MRQRWRAELASPRSQERVAWICVATAVIVIFIATWWRGSTRSGSGARSLTYLLDVLAILIALASTLFEARFANMLGDFPIPSLRRGSLLRLLAGVLAAIVGCAVGTLIDDDRLPNVISALGIAVLAGGLTLMLNGIVRLALVDGARYAADKMQERLDDDY
jgi:hypothetical protein